MHFSKATAVLSFVGLSIAIVLAPTWAADSPFLQPFDVEWMRQLGSPGSERAWAVAGDKREGTIYVAGYTDGDLNASEPGDSEASDSGAISLKQSGSITDAFLIKLGPGGEQLWVRQFGSSLDDWCRAVATDPIGEVYAVGATKGTIEGQPYMGDWDAFLARFSSDGEKRWIQQFGSKEMDEARGVATDSRGNVYVVGRTFGDLELPARRDRGNSNLDFFIAKFNPGGERVWLRQFGSTGNDFVTGFALNEQEGVSYIVGSTTGVLEEGHASLGDEDAFIAKFDDGGNQLWVRQLGSAAGKEEVAAVAVEPSTGFLYIVLHYFEGMLPETGSANLFPTNTTLSRWNEDGEAEWFRELSTFETMERAHSVAFDFSAGAAVVVGSSLKRPRNDVGWQEKNAASAQNADLFIAKYGHDGAEWWRRRPGSERWDEAYAVAVGPRERVYTVGSAEGSFGGLKHNGQADVIVVQWAPMALGQGSFPWPTTQTPPPQFVPGSPTNKTSSPAGMQPSVVSTSNIGARAGRALLIRFAAWLCGMRALALHHHL